MNKTQFDAAKNAHNVTNGITFLEKIKTKVIGGIDTKKNVLGAEARVIHPTKNGKGKKPATIKKDKSGIY